MSIWDNLDVAEETITNLYIENVDQGMALISKLLRENNEQTPLSKVFDEFCEKLEKEYIPFSKKISQDHSTDVFVNLQSFAKRLEEFVMFPALFQKKVIAVGGGFSAGKSMLINMMIGEDFLPTDTTPTTSIPTYIMGGRTHAFYAHNLNGLKTMLDEEAIKAITHAFSEKYNISLAQMLKNILLTTPAFQYDHLTILDTPGYTKSDHHKKELNKDEHMARVHLQSADCLLWVVDIEKGTVPQQDFEFIQSLGIGCPIFFVFNKADKKQEEDLQMIIEIARENILKQGINCAGIGAVSSLLKKEYGQDRLLDFLQSNNEQEKEIDIQQEFSAYFDVFSNGIKKRIDKLKVELKQLNELALSSSEQDAQEILRVMLTAKKKEIASERDHTNLIHQYLQPLLSLLEKLEVMLKDDSVTITDNGYSSSETKTLQALLKINVDQILSRRVIEFTEDIQLARIAPNNLQIYYDTFADSLVLLEAELKVIMEKEINKCLYRSSEWSNVTEFVDVIQSISIEPVELLPIEKLLQNQSIHDETMPLIQWIFEQEGKRIGMMLKEKLITFFHEAMKKRMEVS